MKELSKKSGVLKETDIKDNYKIIKPDYKEESIFIEEVIGEDKLKSILPAFVRNSSNNL